MSKVIFKFNPAVANKELIQSFNHKVYELTGTGEFETTDSDWLSLGKIKIDQYEGEGAARKLVELDAFEFVRHEEVAGPVPAQTTGQEAEQPTGQEAEQGTDQATDQEAEQEADQGAEQAPGQTTEQVTEQAAKGAGRKTRKQ